MSEVPPAAVDEGWKRRADHGDSADDSFGVTAHVGDVSNLESMAAEVVNLDAVINTVGGKTPHKRTNLEASVAKNIVTAMQHDNVRRLVVTSSLGLGDSHRHAFVRRVPTEDFPAPLDRR